MCSFWALLCNLLDLLGTLSKITGRLVGNLWGISGCLMLIGKDNRGGCDCQALAASNKLYDLSLMKASVRADPGWRMARKPCSICKVKSHTRAGFVYSLLRQLADVAFRAERCQELCCGWCMHTQCWWWGAAQQHWSRCPCNIRDFDLGQVPGRVHSYAALELQRVPVASCWGREEYFLSAGGGHNSSQIKQLEGTSRMSCLRCYRNWLDLV